MSHAVVRHIRRIAPAELPTVRDIETREPRPATAQELLNLGMFPLGGDLYSCTEQLTSTLGVGPDGRTRRIWSAPQHPGTIVAEGTISERHARLPADVRPHVMRAKVFTDRALVDANLTEVAAALADNVGDVNGAPLVDVTTTDAALDEARRLAASPDSPVTSVVIPMAAVDPVVHLVEADNLVPHTWQGERH